MRKYHKYYDADSEEFVERSYEYPSELELLEMFPEAKRIVPQKIKDWESEKEALLQKETIPIFRKIKQLPNERSRIFWTTAYLVLSERRKEINGHLKRLRRLKALTTKPKFKSSYENFDALKERAKERPIQELYDFQKLRQVGGRYQALCPFHAEKTPSFVIYPENKFKCFGCQESGDSVAFLQKLQGCDFKEAVQTLGGRK